MTPERLEQLADLADPDQLWKLGPLEYLKLPSEKQAQVDTGVALRRQAAHVREVQALIGTGRSLVITPMGTHGRAAMTVEAPPQHKRLLDVRREAGLE